MIGLIVGAWVSSDYADTQEPEWDNIPDDLKNLPDVRSYGKIHRLRNAMALDTSGKLKGLVQAFVESGNTVEREAILTQILIKLSDAETVVAGYGGAYDDQKLMIIEAFTGRQFYGAGGAKPNAGASTILQQLYHGIVETYYCELAAQTSLQPYLTMLAASAGEDGDKGYNVMMMASTLRYFLKEGKADISILADMSRYLSWHVVNITESYNMFYTFRDCFYTMGPEYIQLIDNNVTGVLGSDEGNNTLIGTSNDDMIFGKGGNDTLHGGDGDDILDGGTGNDTMNGGEGDDTYIFGRGYGYDTITDNQGSNRLKFLAGIAAEDLLVFNSGFHDVTIQIRGTADRIILKNFRFSESYRNFVMEFADGGTMSLTDENGPFLKLIGSEAGEPLTPIFNDLNNCLYGMGGNDTLIGGTGNDILNGGSGNDILRGGAGDDTYVFEKGHGQDKVFDIGGNDKLIIDADAKELYFVRSGSDLLIKNLGSSDSINLESWYSNDSYQIETVSLTNGKSLAASQVELLIQSMASFSTAKNLAWDACLKEYEEETKNILQNVWVRSDGV